MNKEKFKTIVRLNNGWFVSDWQYSQGHLDISETDDIFQAMSITAENYKTFFGKRGDLLSVKYTVEFLKCL